MIDLYAWYTPNGRKMTIMLEEVALDYQIRLVDIDNNEQFSPEFLRISPNNKIPAIIDHEPNSDPVVIFESGAILQYLAEKSGKLLPTSGPARFEVLQWLFWQVSGLGPMIGQFNHFRKEPERYGPAALGRFVSEAKRQFGVLEKRLSESPYVGGPEFSIADISTFTFSVYARANVEAAAGIEFPHCAAWEAKLLQRPALARGAAALTR